MTLKEALGVNGKKITTVRLDLEQNQLVRVACNICL
jgi:hypothetical protein